MFWKNQKNIDLNKTKTAISISKWFKLKLGDTFKVVIYHNERHIAQARKVCESESDFFPRNIEDSEGGTILF